MFGVHASEEPRSHADLKHLVDNRDVEGLVRFAGSKFKKLGDGVGKSLDSGHTPVLFVEQSRHCPNQAKGLYSSRKDPYTSFAEQGFKLREADSFGLMELAFLQSTHLRSASFGVSSRVLLELPSYPKNYVDNWISNYQQVVLGVANNYESDRVDPFVQAVHIDYILGIINRDRQILERLEFACRDRNIKNPTVFGFLGSDHVGISKRKSRIDVLPAFENGAEFGYITPSLSVSLFAYSEKMASLNKEQIAAMKTAIISENVLGIDFSWRNSLLGNKYVNLSRDNPVFQSILNLALHGTFAEW